MTTNPRGVKILVDEPLKNNFFCGFPNRASQLAELRIFRTIYRNTTFTRNFILFSQKNELRTRPVNKDV